MPVLTFPLATLEIIERGLKHCTIRLDARLKNLETGDRLTLAFGARNAPVIRQAVLTRLERFNLEPLMTALLKAAEEQPDELEADDAPLTPEEIEEIVQEIALEVMPDNKAQTLLEVLSASGGTLLDLIVDANARDRFEVFVVWFDLETKAQPGLKGEDNAT